ITGSGVPGGLGWGRSDHTGPPVKLGEPRLIEGAGVTAYLATFAVPGQTWRILPDLSPVASVRDVWELPGGALLPSTCRSTDVSAVVPSTRLADKASGMFHRFLTATCLLPVLLVLSGPALASAQEGPPDMCLANGCVEQGPPTAEHLPF